MTSKVVVQKGGVGFLGWLALLFITLKLCGVTAVASWSWWLVLLPIYGPLAFALICILIVLSVAAITS